MKLIFQSILQTILWTIVVGLLYPLGMTLICQGLFPAQANGSLIMGKDKDGKPAVIGSELIAQQFSGPKYFWPRPSATTPVFSTTPSGASNLGPTSKSLHDNVLNNAKSLRDANKLPTDAPVPSDLVFASGSGIDPHISPEAARFQINRVADARGLKQADVNALVDQFIEQPQWRVFGEARVNVLKLNLALDDKWPSTKPALTPSPTATAPVAASVMASASTP